MRNSKSGSSGNSVRLLLDTQILVWLVNGDGRLRREWTAKIADPASELHVSAVIAFEYTDLQRRNRLPVDEPISELVSRFDMQLASLPTETWQEISKLPDIHRDPVDRMLIAHALVEGMTLLTADANIRRYPVPFV